MPFQHFSRFQIILAYTIGLVLVFFIASSTRASFDKAREQYNKDRLGDIESALNFMIERKANFNKVFTDCVNSWCPIDDSISAKIINTDTDPASQLLIEVPKTADKENFILKVLGSDSYVIQGPTDRRKSLCWIISTDEQQSNISKNAPTDCL